MKSNTSKFILFTAIFIIIVVGLGIFINTRPIKPSKLDGFAQCLKTSGAEFYGAFWCSHCQATKAMFGTAKQYLPYIECSNPDRSQNKICLDKKIEGYPTWIFKDSTRLTGEVSLEKLSEKTQCVLPQ